MQKSLMHCIRIRSFSCQVVLQILHLSIKVSVVPGDNIIDIDTHIHITWAKVSLVVFQNLQPQSLCTFLYDSPLLLADVRLLAQFIW